MHALFGAECLCIALFCTFASSFRVPVKDVREMGKPEKREALPDTGAAAALANIFHQHEKRLVCIYDSVLDSMYRYPEDSVPFCSTFLGIENTKATRTVQARTTVTTIFTTVETLTGPTVTVAGSTVTVTQAQIAKRRAREKRQAATAVTPFSSLAAACTLSPINETLINRVSSGCSCLRIQPETDEVPVTVTSTRLVSGVDYQQTTQLVTVTTDGVQTVTFTIPRPSFPTGPRDGGGGDGDTTPTLSSPGSGSATLPPGTGPGTGIPSTGTGVPGTDSGTPGTGTGIPGTGSGTPSTGTGVPGTGSGTPSIGTGVPGTGSGISGTGTGIPSTETGTSDGGSFTGNPTLPIDTRTGGLETSPSGSFTLPPSSLNSTAPSGTGTGFGSGTNPGTSVGTGGTSPPGQPTLSFDTRTDSPQTSSSAPSGSFTLPPSSFNSTSPGTASTGIVTSIGTGTASTGIAVPPTNTSSFAPTSTPRDFCDNRNGTIYTTKCQAFEILCYANYAGPVFEGLFEESLNECIEECANVNVGFSQDRCYGLVYNVTSTSGSNCFFKTQDGVSDPVEDRDILAAKLVNNNTCTTRFPLNTNPTGFINSTILPTPTGSLNLNVSSRLGSLLTSVPSASFSSSFSGNETTFRPTGPPLILPTGSRNGGVASTGIATGSSNTSWTAPCGVVYSTSVVFTTSTVVTTVTAASD